MNGKPQGHPAPGGCAHFLLLSPVDRSLEALLSSELWPAGLELMGQYDHPPGVLWPRWSVPSGWGGAGGEWGSPSANFRRYMHTVPFCGSLWVERALFCSQKQGRVVVTRGRGEGVRRRWSKVHTSSCKMNKFWDVRHSMVATTDNTVLST